MCSLSKYAPFDVLRERGQSTHVLLQASSMSSVCSISPHNLWLIFLLFCCCCSVSFLFHFIFYCETTPWDSVATLWNNWLLQNKFYAHVRKKYARLQKSGYVRTILMMKFTSHALYAVSHIQCPPLILAPLVNMSKGGCENKSALFILFIFHSKNSQNSNLALKKNNWKWGENLIVK